MNPREATERARSLPHATQPPLWAWTQEDKNQWVHDILSGAAPSDSLYREMEPWMLQALAHTRGLYATRAWQEQTLRSRNRSKGDETQ